MSASDGSGTPGAMFSPALVRRATTRSCGWNT